MTNGILLLDKPIGMSSNQALQKVKRALRIAKAGHTGSLDPLATGMLPLCIGEATKFSQYLLDADKTYQVEARLGIRTNTGDAEGETIATRPVPKLTLSEINQALDHFRGEIEQVPSMFSALKVNGQPLYRLARKGIEVERKSRRITIYELRVLDYKDENISLEIKCSKGTYVRTLVDDFGELIGCGAYVCKLRRVSVGPYSSYGMVSLETLENEYKNNVSILNHYLQPISSMISHWPILQITDEMVFYMKRGQAVRVPRSPLSGLVQLQQKDGTFLGIGEVLSNGMIAPRKLVRK